MRALDYVDQGQLDAAEESMTTLANVWAKYQPFLEMLISHDEMHNVAEHYIEAQIELKRNRLDDYYKTMALLQEMLSHIRKQESINWGNVL